MTASHAPSVTGERTADTRIVYGVGCTWWDSIDKVAVSVRGIPVCPDCLGVLFEVPDEATWWQGVDQHEVERGEAGYRQLIEWARGRCFSNFDALRAAFATRDRL